MIFLKNKGGSDMKFKGKTILIWCFFSIFIVSLHAQNTSIKGKQGYMTLEGKQFKDENGHDFYPIIMNYEADIIHNCGEDIYYIAPSGIYGKEWGYDCIPDDIDPCNYYAIYNDLTEIYNMGFNTIRLMGPKFVKPAFWSGDGFQLPVGNYIHDPILPTLLNTFAPYNNNQIVELLLCKLDEILDIAKECNLKVILVPAGGELQQSDFEATDYSDYLYVYADHFKNYPVALSTILAYDLYNEPTWSYNHNHTKSDVCNYVKEWYDAVKSGDPNHLVTMGLGTFSFMDVFTWDPGVMKLDFASVHIYPSLQHDENYYDWTKAMDRYTDELIWVSNTMPMPWIIGETGLAGTDFGYPPYNNSYYNRDPYNKPPWIQGHLTDQKLFTEETIPLIRNCGASGTAWWEFEDEYWGTFDFLSHTPDWGYYGFFYGLVNSTDYHQTLSTYEKPACSVFQNLNHSAPPLGTKPSASVNYCNPYNYPSTISNNVSKTVYNGFSKIGLSYLPLKDAVINYMNYLKSIDPDPSKDKHPWRYTFTETSGIFNAYPALDDVSLYYPAVIEDFQISYPGYERIERGNQPSVFNPSQIAIYPTQPEPAYYLKSMEELGYDAVISHEIVTSSQPRNFKGWNSLTVSTIIIETGGTSTMTARDEVNLIPGFEAQNGSELHIFISEAFPECSDFSSYLKKIDSFVNIDSTESIELVFLKVNENFDFILYPNPNSGIFHLTLENVQKMNSKSVLNIYNLVGNIIYEKSLTELMNELDVTFLAKGIYFVQVLRENNSKVKKLILQ